MDKNFCARRPPTAAASGIAVGLILVVTAVAAGGVSLQDRGPCPDTVDGVCIPNRSNFGFYAPKWRQWPGDRPPEVTRDESVLERPVPEEVPPFEVPPPETEEKATGPASPGPHGQHGAAGPQTGTDQPGEEADDAPPLPPPSLLDQAPPLGDQLPDGQEHNPSGAIPQLPLSPEPLLPEPVPGEPQGTDADQPGGRSRGLVWRPARAAETSAASRLPAAERPLLDAAGQGPNPLRIGAAGRTRHGRAGRIEPVRRAVFTASTTRQGTPSRRHGANPLRSR